MVASWFPSAVYSNTVYISTSSNTSCLHCLTISQFANRFSGCHGPNTTAILLPGNHILKENLVIQNVLFFSIIAVDSRKKREEEICLSCAEGASITFQSVTDAKVSNITFIGCRAIEVKNVEQFTLEGSIFKSSDDSPGSGLIAIESSIVILRTSFLHLIGSVWNSSSICRYADMCPLDVGGAVIGLHSTVVIFDSVFNGSKANLGGEIYTESSNLVIVNCNFFGHERACKHQCIGGAIFSDKSSVVISICNFVGFKFHRTSHKSASISMTKGGALGFTESCIIINQTNFFGNDAYIGGALYTLISLVFIDNTCFMQNRAFLTGAGMNTNASYIHISNSNFILNLVSTKGTLNAVLSYINVSNSNFFSNRAGVNGGAIKTVNCTINISLSMIVNNTAIWSNGGGIKATHNSTAVIERTIIKDNIAGKSGGGIKMHHDSKLIFLDKVVIKNNTAYYGAAVHVHFTSLECSGMLIIANNSAALGSFFLLYSAGQFVENLNFILENNTGSLLVFNSHLRGQGDISITHNKLRNFTVDTEIQEGSGLSCVLGKVELTGQILIKHNNASNGGAILAVTSGVFLEGDIILSGNSAKDTGGAVYTYHSDIKMKGRILIKKNVAMQKGGGIHSVGSSLTFIHDDFPGASITYLHFESNSAKLGGGVCLEVSSIMYLITRERLLYFVGNQADYGGAIYIADETNNGTCTSSLDSITAASESECFFQSITPKPRLITIHKLFSFSNNIAKYSGSILYGGLLDRCTLNAMTKRHVRYSSLPGFMENILNYTNSDAVRVCFCQDSIANCSYQPKPIRIMKGKQFNVEVVAVDQTNNSLSGKIWSYLLENGSSFGHGQWHQNVNSVCTNLTFVISSSRDTEMLHLYPEGPCKGAGISTRRLKIEFIPCSCPVGFEVSKENQHTCKCDCNTEIEQFVSACNATTSLLTRKGNSWFNEIKYHNETHFITYEYCPFDYCVPTFPEISINLSTPNGADKQCANDRSGILCGKCIPGHCLSLGTSRCLERPSYWAALLIVIIFTALLSGLALVVLILYLNLTVAVGSLNALIFYANIMLASKSVLMPAQGPTFYTLFVAWMNLDIGIDLCIIDKMDMYTKSWIQLAFPIYVISLLFSIIIACEVSTKFANFIGRKNPVATLATLILLSYTILLQSIIVVLSFAHLTYPDHTETVWLADASVKYLRGKHIPLFIAAVMILLLGTVYTLLLISWQWLVKFSSWKVLRWVKNTKLISFMDAYNAPYHPKSRYWTGLLLLARVILYLVSALNPSKEPRVNFVAIMVVTCSLLALSAFHQVYKKCILNILEVATFYNIILISIIQFVAYKTNSAASYISVSISFMTLLCVIAYHIFTITPFRSWVLKRISYCLSEGDAYDDRTRSQHVVTHSEVTLEHATEHI